MCSTYASIGTTPDLTMFLTLRIPINLGGTLDAAFVQEVVLIRYLFGFVLREVVLKLVWVSHWSHLLQTIIRSILDRADMSADFLHPLLDLTQVCWKCS